MDFESKSEVASGMVGVGRGKAWLGLPPLGKKSGVSATEESLNPIAQDTKMLSFAARFGCSKVTESHNE